MSLNPHDARLHVRLAHDYETLDRPFDAAAHYQRALALDGAAGASQVEAHVGLSGLYGRAYQFDEARTHGQAALALAPDHRGAHQNMAVVCDTQGLAEDAEAHRERAYRGAPLIVTRAARPRRRVLTLASAGTRQFAGSLSDSALTLRPPALVHRLRRRGRAGTGL